MAALRSSSILVVSMSRDGLFGLLVLMLLAGCASSPRDPDSGPSPRQVIADGDARGDVHWGGIVVAIHNLRDRTRIQVLALPLDRRGRPRPTAASQGRFLIDQPGFLEPYEYSRRLIEVRGRLDGFDEETVGETAVRLPVLREAELKVWPQAAEWSTPDSPRIQFGIGINNQGGGVGVGIGF